MQIEQMSTMWFSKQTYQKETAILGGSFCFDPQQLLTLLPYITMASDCPQSQRRHPTKGHKPNLGYMMPPASCLLSPNWEDWRQQPNISSSTAMVSPASRLAPFSGVEGHRGQIEGKAEERAGCCFHKAVTPTHIIQVYHSYLKHFADGPQSTRQHGSFLEGCSS